jgi:hypothetical protein
VRLMSAVILLCSLASPAFAECETGAADCNDDVLLHPLPSDNNGGDSKKADDPSLYADPALAPSEDNGRLEAPTNAEEDTPDIDPYTLNPPPE